MKKYLFASLLIFLLAFQVHAGGLVGSGISSGGGPCTMIQDLGAIHGDYWTWLGDANHVVSAGSFTTPGTGYTLTKVDIALSMGAGAPLTSPAIVYLFSYSGQNPSTLLATSIDTHQYTLTGSYDYYTWHFAGFPLLPNTKYWIGIEATLDESALVRIGTATGGTDSVVMGQTGFVWVDLKTTTQTPTMKLYSGSCP